MTASPKVYEEPKVGITVRLPGGKACKVFVTKESQTSQVYEVPLSAIIHIHYVYSNPAIGCAEGVGPL